MKKILFTLAAFVASLSVQADGGMWFLKLMEQQHLADSLKKAGLQMPVNELYSETGPSLKDCVGQFGGGCTAEVISPDGLILTNNHCGYSFVHAMSTLEANYLKDGYFAKSRAEELPVPGLKFTFVVAVEDVTERVEALAKAQDVDGYTMQSWNFLQSIMENLMVNSPYKDKPGIEFEVQPFFGGNQFYLFTTQTFEDVRLVVNPPLNLAQFGGDGDNWIWPRHNPDFALFRVYADKDGQPAQYAATNQPLHRDRYLPISLKGYEEGDFAMIMGFPGTTNRYLSAAQLQREMSSIYQPIVTAGEPLLLWEREQMERNDSVRLAMQQKHMSLQNMVKNFGGALQAVKKVKLNAEKRRLDAALAAYGAKVGNNNYVEAPAKLAQLSTEVADTMYDVVLYQQTIGKNSFMMPYRLLNNYQKALREGDNKLRDETADEMRKYYQNNMEGVNLDELNSKMSILVPIWQQHCKLDASKAMYIASVEEVARNSHFASKERLEDFLASPSLEKLLSDPMWQQAMSTRTVLNDQYYAAARRMVKTDTELSRIYQRGLLDMNGWSTAPDANGTQRLTYGHVKGYSPRDAVRYDYKTFLGGMFEKENAADPDYTVNPRVRQLYNEGNFGRYANKDGKMQTDFLTDNDITGGNSGSPVLNARGELIGVAFDGNIESLSSDFKYNPELQRCINADIRYVLWTIDTFGNCGYLLKEMDIRE